MSENKTDNKVFPTGAQRSKDADGVRYDLISWIGHRRLAETYKEGAIKYGDWNWLKGFPLSDLLNHVEKHLNQYKAGDSSEDHLAHAAWGLYAMMHFEETRLDLVDIITRPQWVKWQHIKFQAEAEQRGIQNKTPRRTRRTKRNSAVST